MGRPKKRGRPRVNPINKEEPGTKGQSMRHRLKAYQVLTHLYFHDHSFYEYLGDNWIRFKSPRLYNLLGMYNPRDLDRKIRFLIKKGYVKDINRTLGVTEVQLLSPEGLAACLSKGSEREPGSEMKVTDLVAEEIKEDSQEDFVYDERGRTMVPESNRGMSSTEENEGVSVNKPIDPTPGPVVSSTKKPKGKWNPRKASFE